MVAAACGRPPAEPALLIFALPHSRSAMDVLIEQAHVHSTRRVHRPRRNSICSARLEWSNAMFFKSEAKLPPCPKQHFDESRRSLAICSLLGSSESLRSSCSNFNGHAEQCMNFMRNHSCASPGNNVLQTARTTSACSFGTRANWFLNATMCAGSGVV